MKRLSPRLLAALALGGLALAAQPARAQIGYALSNDGLSLIRFDLASPGSFATVGNFTGATTGLLGIDFRPANGALYGYSQDNTIVTVDVLTAATTFVATPSTISTTDDLGIDFNPVPDRLRLVNPNDQNLRINVAGGATIVDGNLAFAAGDPNAGVNPNVNEAAYTNNDNNPLTGTTLYYIDPVLDILVTTTNPNGGVLTTVGSLGVDTDINTGFDIYTSPLGVNSAYALLRVGGASSLYSINLGTGAATALGTISAPGPIYGLAINPNAEVPEPGTLALAATGLLPLAGALVRRRRAA